MLTELQKERVSYHLDFVSSRWLLTLDREMALLTLNDSQELALVGQPIGDLTADEIFEFEGTALCSKTSLLGKCELALAKLDPTVIDNSLFVKSAGEVTLRGNETQKREKLYKSMVTQLAQLIGAKDSSMTRVGF